MSRFSSQTWLALLAGAMVGGFFTQTFLLPNTHTHAIANPHSEEYHIHADFLIQVRGEVQELGVAELMTTAEQELHEHAHLHDDDGQVVHMHEENVSFVEFLGSLGFVVSENCLIVFDTEITLTDETDAQLFCSNETESLRLYVNDELWNEPIETYVPEDLDRVLLFLGDKTTDLTSSLAAVPNEACIFSGSCPERGTAPPESCGLTCEL